jgi:hypothetical protein
MTSNVADPHEFSASASEFLAVESGLYRCSVVLRAHNKSWRDISVDSYTFRAQIVFGHFDFLENYKTSSIEMFTLTLTINVPSSGCDSLPFRLQMNKLHNPSSTSNKLLRPPATTKGATKKNSKIQILYTCNEMRGNAYDWQDLIFYLIRKKGSW